MKDIRDEIERLTALLSFRIEHLAKKEGRPVHFSSYAVAVRPGQLVQLFSTLLHLPRGFAATFMPRSQPESDGTWRIDIRRNDGVTRESWFDGIVVGSDGNEMTLLHKGQPLTMDDLERIIGDLTKPGLSGMALDINRLYRMFFGRMEHVVIDALDAVRDVDLLDDIYTALLSGKSQRVVDQLIQQTVESAPLASAASPPVSVEPAPAALAAAELVEPPFIAPSETPAEPALAVAPSETPAEPALAVAPSETPSENP